DFLLLFAAVTMWNYLFGLRIHAHAGTRTARRWVVAGVTGNLATLGYFKYANFGVANINAVLESIGLEPFVPAALIRPIGLSVHSFQWISSLFGVCRRDTAPTRNLISFAAFIALFPQLIAAPVLRYKDLAGQFTDRTHSLDKFSEG